MLNIDNLPEIGIIGVIHSFILSYFVYLGVPKKFIKPINLVIALVLSFVMFPFIDIQTFVFTAFAIALAAEVSYDVSHTAIKLCDSKVYTNYNQDNHVDENVENETNG